MLELQGRVTLLAYLQIILVVLHQSEFPFHLHPLGVLDEPAENILQHQGILDWGLLLLDQLDEILVGLFGLLQLLLEVLDSDQSLGEVDVGVGRNGIRPRKVLFEVGMYFLRLDVFVPQKTERILEQSLVLLRNHIEHLEEKLIEVILDQSVVALDLYLELFLTPLITFENFNGALSRVFHEKLQLFGSFLLRNEISPQLLDLKDHLLLFVHFAALEFLLQTPHLRLLLPNVLQQVLLLLEAMDEVVKSQLYFLLLLLVQDAVPEIELLSALGHEDGGKLHLLSLGLISQHLPNLLEYEGVEQDLRLEIQILLSQHGQLILKDLLLLLQLLVRLVLGVELLVQDGLVSQLLKLNLLLLQLLGELH